MAVAFAPAPAGVSLECTGGEGTPPPQTHYHHDYPGGSGHRAARFRRWRSSRRSTSGRSSATTRATRGGGARPLHPLQRHAAPALYAALAEAGFFPVALLRSLRKAGSPSRGTQTCACCPGWKLTGSLGQGPRSAWGTPWRPGWITGSTASTCSPATARTTRARYGGGDGCRHIPPRPAHLHHRPQRVPADGAGARGDAVGALADSGAPSAGMPATSMGTTWSGARCAARRRARSRAAHGDHRLHPQGSGVSFVENDYHLPRQGADPRGGRSRPGGAGMEVGSEALRVARPPGGVRRGAARSRALPTPRWWWWMPT